MSSSWGRRVNKIACFRQGVAVGKRRRIDLIQGGDNRETKSFGPNGSCRFTHYYNYMMIGSACGRSHLVNRMV